MHARFARLAAVSLLLVAALLASACGGSERDGPARTPQDFNLVLIVVDTCRADRLSPYGGEARTSPYLSELARSAVVFRDCTATSTGTGPSHLSLFTGQYPHRHGLVEHGPAVDPVYTLASLLKDAGWQTASFNGGGYLRPNFGLNAGFDSYRAPGGPLGDLKRTIRESYPPAIEWLKVYGQSRFFLFLHGYDPHCPYWPPANERQRFAGWYQGSFDPRGKCGKDYLDLIAAGALGEEEQRYLRDLYDGGVASADQWIRSVVAFLRSQELLDESILVITSDHGESLGEHDYYGHLNIWDEQQRVPLLLRFPGGQWATTHDAPVELVDLLPTLLDALGVDEPDGVQGRNLMPLVRSEATDWPEERMRICRYAELESVRFGTRWKLVLRHAEDGIAERALYDLESDPGELQNLYSTDEGRQVFERLFERYRAWRQQTSEEDRRYWIRRQRPEQDDQALRELGALGYVEGEEGDGR